MVNVEKGYSAMDDLDIQNIIHFVIKKSFLFSHFHYPAVLWAVTLMKYLVAESSPLIVYLMSLGEMLFATMTYLGNISCRYSITKYNIGQPPVPKASSRTVMDVLFTSSNSEGFGTSGSARLKSTFFCF